MIRLFGESGDMKAPDRAYMSEQIGWNYKLSEVNSALARVRLRHLDEFIDGTMANAARLSARIGAIEGVTPLAAPDDRTYTCYLYNIALDPAAMNLDIEPGKLRDVAMAALKAENVDVMRWQKVPVPAQPMFQNKFGYGNASPWDLPGADVDYDIEQFPNAFAALENSFIVRRIIPPNGPELMDSIADAFEKVFPQFHRAVEFYDESNTYVPLAQRKAKLATGKL
jgi:dTDP-4-amino-4,6-dideoxygalactose transaminase